MAEFYDTTRFGELYYASRAPSDDHLGLAAKHITDTLTHYQIPFAIIGGWAIFLRGSGRQTMDVDIAVGTTMEYLKRILIVNPRICFPAIHGQTSVQIFVRTGHSYDQGYENTPDMNVSLDMVIAGNLGTPVDLSTSNDCIQPTVATTQGSTARVLSLFPQLHAKLSAFASRGHSNDNDFQDLVFLISTYGSQLSTYKAHLDEGQRKAFATAFESRYGGSDAAIEFVKDVLGVD